MQVLYLAKKYIVPSLAKKCTEYLRDNLNASNVFFILPHAQKFENKDLEDRCWKVIKEQKRKKERKERKKRKKEKKERKERKK